MSRPKKEKFIVTRGIQQFDLSGRTALITGSSQGIGFAVARGLGDAGARLVLNGRDTDKLAQAAEDLREAGLSVEELAFDATDHVAVKTAFDGFKVNNGAIDILVNNAGVQFRTPLEDFPSAMFDKLLATNVATVFHVGQAIPRHMMGRGACKIVNIASVQTALARPGIALYTATKGAVGDLTKGMATDWAKHGLAGQRHCARLFRHTAQRRTGRRPRIQRLAGETHPRRTLGQCRGTGRRLHFSVVRRIQFRQRSYIVCRWRHHRLSVTPCGCSSSWVFRVAASRRSRRRCRPQPAARPSTATIFTARQYPQDDCRHSADRRRPLAVARPCCTSDGQ